MFEVGTQLGRFAITRFIGAGGMGEVYEARDPELNRAVAIKVLRDDGSSLRLLREAQALAQLSHPNVVGIYDVGVAGDRLYFAMEYIDGKSLDVYLRDRPRSWRGIVKLYLQAAEGLIAAHARSLVHRDFKPGNVLVDGSGRARVTDFGLARLDSTNEPGAAVTDGAAPSGAVSGDAVTVDAATVDPHRKADHVATSSPGGVLGSPLTGAGALLGTPRYMAPEQRARQQATARSDQYSFCVSLWEALFGAIDAPARGAPRWLERALTTGLAEDPSARHASMKLLAARLERTPIRRRRIAIAIGFAVVASGAAAGAMWPRGPSVDCARAGAEIDGVWSASDRTAVTRAFTPARANGAETATRVLAALDHYTGTWRDARIDACRATHERGEESPALLDRRAACLDAGRLAVGALVPRLRAADGHAVDRAIDAVAALPDVSACTAARLTSAGIPSTDPRAAPIRAQLADARAAFELGRVADARAAAATALTAARALGDEALLADALVVSGHVVIDKDEPHGRADLEEAMTHAARVHDSEREAAAAYYLFHTAVDDEDAARADSLLPVVRAAIARAGDSPWEIEEASAEADLLMSRGKIDDSLAVCDRLATLDPQDRKGYVADCRCTANLTGERYDAALAQCTLDVDRTERRYGRGHIRTTSTMHNLALVNGHLGDYAKEVELDERVLAIKQGVNGDSLGVVDELADLADTLMYLHRYDDALARGQQALGMLDRIGGAPTQDHAIAHFTVGSILLHLDRPADAITHLELSLQITTKVAGPDDSSIAGELGELGNAYLAAGRPDDALASAQRGATIVDKDFGPTSQAAAQFAASEAAALVALRRAREAVPLAAKALAIGASAHLRPVDLAETQLTLGRALLATGDRARARAVLGAARDAYRAAGADWAKDLATVEQLLAK